MGRGDLGVGAPVCSNATYHQITLAVTVNVLLQHLAEVHLSASSVCVEK